MSDYWDADAKRIHGIMSVSSEHRERRRVEALVRSLNSLPKGALVLDAGMGDGYLLSELASLGYECQGLDISEERIVSARHRLAKLSLQATLTRGSITEMPYADSLVDAVVCSEVLEHLDSPEMAVREMARVVRPMGMVIVSVPWNEDLRSDICPDCGAHVATHGHVQSFSVSSLSRLLSSAGLVVERAKGLGSGPSLRGPLARHTAAMPPRLWRGLDALARSAFTPEWMVVSARRAGPSSVPEIASGAESET